MRRIILLWLCCLSFVFAAVNLNSASKDELMSIKGIGEKKAERIIQYRQKKKFKSVEELDNVKGFGSILIQKIKPQLVVKN